MDKQEFENWLTQMRKEEKAVVWHLPVLATVNKDGTPNLAVKGIGLHKVGNELCLVGLEIFGRKTFINLMRERRCSLMFNDFETCTSLEVKCSVEILSQDDEIFKEHAARHNSYHKKGIFLCGYLFKIESVQNKSP